MMIAGWAIRFWYLSLVIARGSQSTPIEDWASSEGQ